jgi:hypothetical protein
MIPNSGVLQRPSRRIVLLTKIKATTMRIGSTSMAFFRKGEELEATGFENLPHDDPSLVPPKLGFRGFDRVPRRYAPLLIAVLMVAVAALCVFRWRSVRDVSRETARAAASLRGKASGDWVRLKASVASSRGAP